MMRQVIGRLVSTKTLLRVAFTALSLTVGIGAAIAGPPDKANTAPSGDAYNFVRGGGG
jgi:hypothetical protein